MAIRKAVEVKGWTTRGLGWERRQSVYFALYLTWFLYWVPLVYTGLRVLQPKWVVWGALYGLPFIISIFIGPGGEFQDWLDRWQYLAFIVSLGHTWLARGEFLARLDEMESDREEVVAAASGQAEDPSEAGGEAGASRAAQADSPVVDFFSTAPEPPRRASPPIEFTPDRAQAARTVDSGPGEGTPGAVPTARPEPAKPAKPGGRVVDV